MKTTRHRASAATPGRSSLAPAIIALGCIGLPLAVEAESDAGAVRLDPVVVTATRGSERSFDLPASIDRIDADLIQRGQPMVNLSETLVRIPGIVAQNRQNYAQDLQISSRGFGARAPFGVRGVRLIQDGIPATMPDGQGQTGSFSLFSAQRIEILRGPFSALYGNASGGVISVFSENGRQPPVLAGSFGAGSFASTSAGLKASGIAGALGYVVALTRFATDGYRDHSAAERDLANVKLSFDVDPATRLTVVATQQTQRDSQDPLGLSRMQWEANPRQVDASALQFDTRKSIRQAQGGISVEQRLGHDAMLQLTGYGGSRRIRQYLAFSGVAPASSGGVTDLDRQYAGLGARLAWSTQVADAPVKLTLGVDIDRQDERRQGYVNDNGRLGALRRDEDDRVRNIDGYAQLEFVPHPALSVSAGLRHSDVAFRSDDRYVTSANPDDSGRRDFSHASPVLGVVWHAGEAVNVYLNYGQGFETPTFAELAYRPGGPGLNLALDAGTSDAWELGVKALVTQRHRVNIAAFVVDTRDEIVVNAATGGRTTYKNAGATKRRGVEALWDGTWAGGFTTHLALTWLRAEFSDSFLTGGVPQPVPAGARLPGVPAVSAFGEVVWTPGGWAGMQAALEVQCTGKLYVNDRNSDAAPSAAVANLRLGFAQKLGRVSLREFIRANNVFDRKLAGSVIVGDTNGRYFEPAPGRNWYGGVDASFEF